MIKVFIACDISYRTIENEHFKICLKMNRFTLILSHRIKLNQLVTTNYENIRDHFKNELKKIDRIFISLNAWSNFQKVVYLNVMIYWMNFNFQYQKRFIDFVSLNVRHEKQKMLNFLLSIFEFYKITNKLLTILIDNAFNNVILKNLLNKTIKKINITWNLKQNFMNCLIYVCNLIAQNFINSIDIIR